MCSLSEKNMMNTKKFKHQSERLKFDVFLTLSKNIFVLDSVDTNVFSL